MRFLAGLFLIAALPFNIHAQAPQPGALTARVTYRDDTTQHFAVYAPPQYAAGQPLPLVFLMDPRGRALIPLALFRRAADRFGYLLVSSYNTVSDSTLEPNDRAVEAMTRWAQRNLRFNGSRIYFAGFSGTAIMGWGYAAQMAPTPAGLFGYGGGLRIPYMLTQLRNTGFAFFGAAGFTDFNYEEVRAVPLATKPYNVPTRIEFYPGGHSWGPETTIFRGAEWMELQAKRRNIAPQDSAWVDSLATRRLHEATTLDSLGKPADALLEFRAFADDFTGLRDVSIAVNAVKRLEADKRVRRELERRDELAKRELEYRNRLARWVDTVKNTSHIPDRDRALKDLDIESLRKEAARTDDQTLALASRRVLEALYATVSFYGPRGIASSAPDRALVMLQVANVIKPDAPDPCMGMARALARLARRAEASDAIACALKNKVPLATIEKDSLLAPLLRH